MNICHACAAPLTGEYKEPSEKYCKGCCNEKGELKTREAIQQGIAQWFMSWQPDIDQATALKRADLYLQAMPVFAKQTS